MVVHSEIARPPGLTGRVERRYRAPPIVTAERTVIRRARSRGDDWARIGRLLRRSRQAVRQRYRVFDGTHEPTGLDGPRQF